MADDKPLGQPVPVKVKDAMAAGRRVMMRDAAKRRLCARFERGDTYTFLNEKNVLNAQPTVTFANGAGKPPHRIRNTYNFIRPIIEDKVSSATQRVPGYDVTPSTTDPEDISGAHLAEKVALYGYDKWRVRGVTIDGVKAAIGQGGSAYAFPYFDGSVGPYTEIEGKWVGEGEVKILLLGGNQVYWQAGAKFDDARWYALERARPIDDVKDTPGFVGGSLSADATITDVPLDNANDRADMVMVTEYFERPCSKYPDGRRLTIANGTVIVDYRKLDPTAEGSWEPYPLQDVDGTVIDEPLIHRLVYTHDPDTDNDLGLTWQLIDAQRTVQDCWNKLLEWKNRCLNPQMIAAEGSLSSRPDDVPGNVRYFKGQVAPTWENPPQVPQALFQMLSAMKQDMREMSAYEDVHADPDLAAKTVAAVIEQSQARWQSFLGDLAEWHSRVMRHCLLLVARYYTEPRLLLIRGRTGWEPIKDFRGSQLFGQVNVRVSPGSLDYLTKAQVFQRVQYFASMGWITGEQAMAAIDGGTAAKLVESYELDVAKANRIIQRIRDGSVMEMPTRQEQVPGIDPATGEPGQQTQEVPGWMPSDFDNLDVWQHTFADWMKTEDYESLEPQMQEVAKLVWQGLQDLQTQKQQRDMAAQSAQAEQLGMNNAAKTPMPKPQPSQPAPV